MTKYEEMLKTMNESANGVEALVEGLTPAQAGQIINEFIMSDFYEENYGTLYKALINVVRRDPESAKCIAK